MRNILYIFISVFFSLFIVACSSTNDIIFGDEDVLSEQVLAEDVPVEEATLPNDVDITDQVPISLEL